MTLIPGNQPSFCQASLCYGLPWVDSVSTLTLARLSILPRCHCKHGSPPRSKLYPEKSWGRGVFRYAACRIDGRFFWSNSFYTSMRCPVDLWQQWTCLFFPPTPQKNEHSTWKKSFEDWRLLPSCGASLTSSKCGFHGMFVQVRCYSLQGAAVPPYCVPLFSHLGSLWLEGLQAAGHLCKASNLSSDTFKAEI